MERSNDGILDTSSESFKKKRSNDGSSYKSLKKKQKTNYYDIQEKFKCPIFYFDKSLLIKEFLEEFSKIICVTGPSKHGKTVNLIMMRYFFEMNYEDKNNRKNRELFENLEIAKEVKDGKRYIDLYQSQYPVIYIDFKKFIIRNSYQETMDSFKYFIQTLYINYQEVIIKNLSEEEKITWNNFINLNANFNNLINSINFLCKSLKKIFKKQIILLIDNYDSPLLNSLNTDFYNNIYFLYKELFEKIFNKNENYLFKTFITGKINVCFFNKFESKDYTICDNECIKYYSITDSELEDLLSKFNLKNKNKIFDNYCNNYFSSTVYDDNCNNNNNDDKTKYYDLYLVKNYIQNYNNEITVEEKINNFLENHEFFNVVFETFDYLMIKDIDFLLKNGSIEKNVESILTLNFKMLTKDYIKSNRDIIWTLLIKYGYLSMANTSYGNKHIKLFIKNEVIKKFIEKKFSKYKKRFYEKYNNIIDFFIKNYDEEKIENSLKNLIIEKKYNTEYDSLNKYYTLIYSLLSLKGEYAVVTKNNFNENDDIHELLYTDKKYLDKLNNNSDNNIKNSNNYNNNENKNDQSKTNSSEIFYISIKKLSNNEEINQGCIQALNNNDDFIFNDCNLKNKFDKIIKFGIAVYGNKCGVIYEINYGKFFKREEMPKIIYPDDNFYEFSTNNYYFVDKTRMISKLILQNKGSYLITRPRRFGKTLNLRMIQEFFEKPSYKNTDENNYKNINKNALFDGLDVSQKRENMREFHKYPVIYLNLKDNESKTYESAITFLKLRITKLFKYYKDIINFEELSEEDKIKWNEIEKGEENEIILLDSVEFLCECIINQNIYKRQFIVLIDEYDKVLINSIENGYYSKINGIIKSLFSNIFKGNINLKFGILTGCLDIGLKGIFSGTNNFFKCSLLFDDTFSDCYGFTDSELDNIFSYFGISSKVKDEVKNRYNGYSCGTNNSDGIIKNLYNPFSIIKFIKNNINSSERFFLKNHWINSGTDSILKTVILKTKFDFVQDFFKLINGDTLKVKISETLDIKDKFKYSDIKSGEVWFILLFSGYITITDEYKDNIQKNDQEDETSNEQNNKKVIENNTKIIYEIGNNIYNIKIPNKEVLEKFIDLNRYCLQNKCNNLKKNIRK